MTADHIDETAAPLIEHLAELRTRILYALAAYVVAVILCYIIWHPVFTFLTHPICEALSARGQTCQLSLIKLQEGFFVAINIAMLGGFALAFPMIGFQLWRFVAPGLYRNEKRAFLPFLIASPVMFFLGAAFCYYVILPMAFSFFLGFQMGDVVAGADATDPANQMAVIGFTGSMEEYLKLTTKFVMAFGICFQMPVALTLLGKAGLVSAQALASVRKYAVVAMLTVAAIVTPPDVMSQVIMFAVIYPLYEGSIFLVRRMEKKREAQMRAEGTWIDDEDDAE
ncbi:twin-arginine translocase subunit TatC [Rhodobacter capsulatus]|uniref:Sec-independent protein translocase protein TatC n=1 Tax=Rhodobacter capsulatus TaxID=1061 RepID=A0A4U1JWA3_RHOCA|nr:twin-arginine translocase subunit TatC [Rhodobacter capsulatus]TKD22688.1 twin-arginine translocase subunit TatC [Rhodobacter capsulatus]